MKQLGNGPIAASRQAPIDMQHRTDYPELDWTASQRVIALLAARILAEGLPAETSLLNVNVPASAGPATAIRQTRQSRWSSTRFGRPGRHSFEAPWQLGFEPDPQAGQDEPGSDIHAFFVEQAISVTAISWDMSANARWQL